MTSVFQPNRLLMRIVFLTSVLASALAVHASESPVAARWNGAVQIPGREVNLIVDLARDAKGQWVGSVILPGFDVDGAPLANLSVKDSAVSFDIDGALGGVKVVGNVHGGTFAGKFEQGGNTASFTLHRGGPPGVELPRHSTAVAKQMEGDWEGDFNAADHMVHVRLSLLNHADGMATAKLDVRGRQETKLDVGLVTQESDLITLDIPDQYLVYEGQLQASEIRGTWVNGSFECPLVFHRAASH